MTAVPLHAALAPTERPPRPGPLSAALTFGWRGMLKIKHVPEQLVDVTLTPVLFLLMFTYLFGGAVAGSTSDYLQFLLPGMLVQSVLFTAVYSGVTLNTDMTKGVVDRFRTLPIWRPAPLVGAVLGDCVRYAVAATVVVVLGVALGFDAEAGVGGVLLAVLLVVVFAFGLAWIFTTVGLVMRAPNAVMNTGFMALFPLVFLSNIFVEPSTLPGWLEAFVDVNPISHLTTAVRGLMAGSASAGEIALPLAAAAALTAIFAFAHVRAGLHGVRPALPETNPSSLSWETAWHGDLIYLFDMDRGIAILRLRRGAGSRTVVCPLFRTPS
jgi:ABC-2 type transport system permease protein